ncbi:MAG TPA: heme biosynthesis HemY N-terminal domain-containing protein [Stellaceae bacterium]|nr:heme biosynthesis HemY N-terminal domain-containing protein [Stellaceae bacterium]
MRRLLGLLLALAIVAALVYVAVFFAENPGEVHIVWGNLRADPPLGRVVAALAALFAVAVLLLWLLRVLIRSPRAFLKSRREKRRREGYRALTQGMVAVAAGEADEARRLARKADSLLAEPPLTLLLQAQSAQLDGDERAARNYFLAMLERAETEFLGLRGLLTQALKSGNDAEALELAERARTLRPKTGWALAHLGELQARAGRWKDAEATLAQALKRKAIAPNHHRRAQAAVLLERSRAAAGSRDTRIALDLADRAQDTDPSFAPAAAWRATLLRDDGRQRQAQRVIEAAWRAAPEPALAEVYASLVPDETPLQRMQRLQHLAAANPDHLESHLLLAEAALKARLWGEARRHLARAGVPADGAADAPLPPARASRLMAEVEEAETHDSARARFWMSRAAAAAALEPTYVCGKCGAESQRWVAVCPSCRAFATFEWRAPLHGPRDQLAILAPPAASPATAATALAAPSTTLSASEPPALPLAPRLTAPNPGR